jgi:rSAM/selenodomain-associated transferase 1
MKPSESHMIVFSKAPIPGQVKTRLIPSLGAQGAATLYERMVRHSLAIAVEASPGSVGLWCTPTMEDSFFKNCEKEFNVALHLQREGDLGKRMAHAFQETLKISSHAILIGTDCPSLTLDDLRNARTILCEGRDAVIVPAEDGGYLLMGLRRYAPELFTGIAWGMETVLEETRHWLRVLGWKWHELPERWDVDRPEDVERLRNEGYTELISASPKA